MKDMALTLTESPLPLLEADSAFKINGKSRPAPSGMKSIGSRPLAKVSCSKLEKLERYDPDVKYVNRLMTHSWGQKVIRFYDPDGNLIEVGTPV